MVDVTGAPPVHGVLPTVHSPRRKARTIGPTIAVEITGSQSDRLHIDASRRRVPWFVGAASDVMFWVRHALGGEESNQGPDGCLRGALRGERVVSSILSSVRSRPSPAN